MLYLTTGANGAGKTLFTLKHIHDLALKESRPVYHNGRFEPVVDGPLKSWTKIDIKDWQTVPDGAIFMVDECHNDFPIRTGKDGPPEYIRMLAEHRRRGFDFFLITQHPMNIDAFVRRLIGSPGWHRHLKRASGAPLVSMLEWPAVNDQPQKAGSGESGQVSMKPYPKEVFDWYVSTSLDTAKVKIPFQVKLLVGVLLALPVIGYFAYSSLQDNLINKPLATKAGDDPATVFGAPKNNLPQNSASSEMTPEQYVASFQPRIEGLPHTAPRYDSATTPTLAPYPAACVSMGSRCSCYTSQATKLVVPDNLCRQIVAGGYFMDWQAAISQASSGQPVRAEPTPPPLPIASLTANQITPAVTAQQGI